MFPAYISIDLPFTITTFSKEKYKKVNDNLYYSNELIRFKQDKKNSILKKYKIISEYLEKNYPNNKFYVDNFNIDELIFPESEFVVDGKLAPSSSGYFDVVIDPTGSSVAVRFDVSLDLSELSEYAYKLSEDFKNFIRVDLYVFHKKIYLSELTFDSVNGFPFFPKEKIVIEAGKNFTKYE